MSPLLLRLATLYGPKFVRLFAASAPVFKKIKPPRFPSSLDPNVSAKMANYIRLYTKPQRYTQKIASEGSKLMKDYPNLFTSTSKEVNTAQSWRLAQALRNYKPPKAVRSAQYQQKKLEDLRKHQELGRWLDKRLGINRK